MSTLSFAPVPTEHELKSYQFIATIAASNPYWRRLGGNGKPDEIIATILCAMLMGRELGIPPMQCVSGGINNIQGKFEISARIMNQLIRKRGHHINVKMSTDEICVIWSKRHDTGEELTVEYSIHDAARANLIKEGGGWKKCPKDMCFARAISRLARQMYPDCISSCYIEGELQETAQGKAIETVNVPDESEVNTAPVAPEEPVDFKYPEDINAEHMDLYFAENAARSKTTVNYVKQRANENPEGFLGMFKKWEKEKFPEEEKIEEALP